MVLQAWGCSSLCVPSAVCPPAPAVAVAASSRRFWCPWELAPGMLHGTQSPGKMGVEGSHQGDEAICVSLSLLVSRLILGTSVWSRVLVSSAVDSCRIAGCRHGPGPAAG